MCVFVCGWVGGCVGVLGGGVGVLGGVLGAKTFEKQLETLGRIFTFFLVQKTLTIITRLGFFSGVAGSIWSTVSSSILSAIKTYKCKLIRDEFKRTPYVMLNQKMHYLLTIKKDEYFEIIYTKHKPKMRYAPSVKDNGNSKSSRFVILTVHKIISKKYAATFNI